MCREEMHKYNVLIAMGNITTAYKLAELLYSHGFASNCVSGCTDALSLLESHSFDIAMVDVSLSDGDGYTLCSVIKEKYSVPVIFISSLSAERNIITAFDMGAEDFISIPFREKELIARILKAVNRTNSIAIIKFHDIYVDTVKGMVTKKGKEIFLSALEYRMLLLFLTNRGKILSRNKLLEEVWAMDGNYINDNTLTVYIKRLREKIKDHPAWTLATVWGIGYKFEVKTK